MDMLLGCLQKSGKLLCNGDTVNDIFLLLMIYDCFYEHTAFFYWYINFHTVIIAHFCTCICTQSCFGGLIEQSGYLVYFSNTADFWDPQGLG